MRRFIGLLFILFFITSCASVNRKAGDNDYEKDFEFRETPYSNCYNVLPFTLNYTQSKCYPIYKINNSFLLLDTGTDWTYVGKKGLSDLFASIYDEVMKHTDELENDGNVEIFLNPVGYWILPSFSGDQKNLPFRFANCDFPEFDGIIGNDSFRNFSNVIFDYKNKLIVFDGETIDGDALPMIIDENGLCFIEFLCDGKKETGMIDTGADSLIMRSTFFEKPCEYNHASKEKIKELQRRGVKQTKSKIYTFKEIQIGSTKYSKMKGRLASDQQVKITDEARGRLTEYSLLGFPFFEGKIIQLDYKNKVFRIGKEDK